MIGWKFGAIRGRRSLLAERGMVPLLEVRTKFGVIKGAKVKILVRSEEVRTK